MRPKPNILLSHVNPKSYKERQVLQASGIYAVFYDGKPINIRDLNSLVNYPGPKYPKVAFANPGQAHRLCAKLSKLFRTDRFSVVELTAGVVVKPEH